MELSKFGFGSFDAFHIACAEMEKVDVMLTTDDKILKLFMKNLKSINNYS
jgi:predicted nucleic acid-binding protein